MAFVRANNTLELVKELIGYIEGNMTKEQFGPISFIGEWNQRYNTQLNIKNKKGRLDVSDSDLKDEKISYIFMEMSSVYSGIMSALKKKKGGYEVKPDKKHILDKFTYTKVVARLKSAVNMYISDSFEHDVDIGSDESLNVKFVGCLIPKNEDSRIGVLIDNYLNEHKLKLYKLTPEEIKIAEIYARPW